MNCDGSVFFDNLSGKYKFHCHLTGATGTLYEDRSAFVIIYGRILLRMRNGSDNSCRENQNTHFEFGNFILKIVPFVR
jgi:hypothetical protein